MEWHLTYIGKTLQRLVASHAVPAGCPEVTTAPNFTSERMFGTEVIYRAKSLWKNKRWIKNKTVKFVLLDAHNKETYVPT